MCVFMPIRAEKALPGGFERQCFHDFSLFPPHFFFFFQLLSSEVATVDRLHPSRPIPCLLYSSTLILHYIHESSNPALDRSGKAVMFAIRIFVLSRMPFWPNLFIRAWEVQRRCPSDGCFMTATRFFFSTFSSFCHHEKVNARQKVCSWRRSGWWTGQRKCRDFDPGEVNRFCHAHTLANSETLKMRKIFKTWLPSLKTPHNSLSAFKRMEISWQRNRPFSC